MKRIVHREGLLWAFALAACAGWGPDGHCIVGRIAEQRLTPMARAAVRDLLGEQDLAAASNWADEIKSDSQWDWARSWHYANVRSGAAHFDFERDCPADGCVVQAIMTTAGVLRDPSASRTARQQALRFLVHFAGDIHQPLHVSLASDRGGNDIAVTFFEEPANLHAVWDEHLVTHGRPTWQEQAARLQASLTPEQARRWSAELNPRRWADESYQLALNLAYRIPADKHLTQEYCDRCQPVVDERLTAGGVRLAALLNAIFDPAAALPFEDRPVRFAGSRRSDVYHRLGCPALQNIEPANLRKYHVAPADKRLHENCPGTAE